MKRTITHCFWHKKKKIKSEEGMAFEYVVEEEGIHDLFLVYGINMQGMLRGF